MDESNGSEGRRDLGKDAEREEEGEGKRLKNRMRMKDDGRSCCGGGEKGG
jgi:hypothetical protein